MEPSSEGQVYDAGGGVPLRIGADVHIVKAMTGTQDGLAVLESTAAPGDPAPRDHVHRSYDEAFYVLEGQFEFRLGDRVARLGPGGFAAIPRGIAHTYKNCGDTVGRVLILGAPGRTAQMLEDIGALVGTAGPLPVDGLARVLSRHDTELVPPLSSPAGRDSGA